MGESIDIEGSGPSHPGKEGFFPVDRNALAPDARVPFLLFVAEGERFVPLVMKAGGSFASLSGIPLPAWGDIFIQASETHLYQDYLLSLLKDRRNRRESRIGMQALLLKEQMRMILKGIFDNRISREEIGALVSLTGHLIDCFHRDCSVLRGLITASKYAYYPFLHSVNVALLSVGMGMYLHLERKRLIHLGLGALLHDLGRCSLPQALLDRLGAFDAAEYLRYTTHVAEGERVLVYFREIPWESLDAVLQHHERLSGKGYPSRLPGRRIRLFGRITGIADSFDLLTTPRRGKRPLSAASALLLLRKEAEEYDGALVRTLAGMLEGANRFA
ncbi:MAG: HD domain-containing protein [Alphaproteobacteria bacterium]|uniref:HD domain-containing protein n=1 Tax=Candidatus Nitrobium versatile TaxID=2884831 RepID=A0A953J8Z3_9BACT|nr:HD domain-containing protein [Candidatus Nitrobium versatile]